MTEVASLVPVDHRVATVRHYEAGPPEGLPLVEPGDTVATTKEEEWVSKKKTEVTNTKQIETRVKRQVVLEDGKVVEDSGPVVTTNTTEDSETHEHHQTELRKLGEDDEEKQKALEGKAEKDEEDNGRWVAVPNPEGIVREVKERRVLSREETEELKETEDVQHLGDITDKEFLEAVHSGQPDLRPILRANEGGRAVVSTGPRLIHESSRTNKVTDTEDTRELSSVLPDGRIVTETQRTTEHEELKDEDLPDDAPDQNVHKESHQRFLKTREQQDVDYVADGVNVGHEMRFKTENMEVERRGDGMDDFLDWDSLSARARRRNARPPHRYRGVDAAAPPQQQTPLDRKDALTKKPLNFDVEEETRKHETSKWLEHHFGSDSRSSNNSIDDEEEQPPKTSFFNVTIKSQPTPTANVYSPPRAYSPVEHEVQSSRYFQGVSEWSERRRETDYRRASPVEEPRDYRIIRTSPPLREATPTPPQRKRAAERRQRMSQDSNRYDSGYRTPSRNDCREEQPLEEPPPDYSPPTPPPVAVAEKRQQKTRFAPETQTHAPQKHKSGNIIGQSIRKLVGKIRSASAERKAKQRAKRSPSPSYQKGHVIDNNIHPSAMDRPRSPPVHRYYLGEDPFGGSIYGRENKYDGVKPAGRTSRRPPREEEGGRSQSTLGRFSKSTGRLASRQTQEPRSSQTLPRHLSRHEPPTRLEKGDRSNSTINVSIINTVNTPPIVNGGPPKPARSYRSNLSRSKSLNVHAADMDPQRPSVHKSNPHLHRLDQNPVGLKSPALISSLSRSQRDLNEVNSGVDQQQQYSSYTPRFGKNGYGDGNSYDTTDSKKVFMKTLKDRAPELFKTLHENEEDSWRGPAAYSTPSKPLRHVYNGGDPYEPPTRLRESPGGVTTAVIRRGSNSSNDFSETYRTTSRNDDPLRPSVTNTVQTFSKKTLPGRAGRGVETIESTETKSVTKSRYRGEPSYKVYDEGRGNGMRGSPVVIEVRNNYRK